MILDIIDWSLIVIEIIFNLPSPEIVGFSSYLVIRDIILFFISTIFLGKILFLLVNHWVYYILLNLEIVYFISHKKYFTYHYLLITWSILLY